MDHTFSSISSFCLPGQKAPLDFTLKTCMRVQSSSSVSWSENILSSCSSLYRFWCLQ